MEEVKALVESDLKQAGIREVNLVQNVRSLKSSVEKAQSERSFLQEKLKEMEIVLRDKDEAIDKIRFDAEDAKTQLAHCKHENGSLAKQLRDSRAEYQRCHEKECDLQDRWLKVTSQADDVNNKLSNRIAEIAALQKKFLKQDKKARELKRDLEQCRGVIHLTREEMKSLRAENKNVREALRQNETRMVAMKNQMDKNLRERDLIAAQMMRRTDENDVLERQVTTLKLTIERGDGMYSERLDDIKLLKNEIGSLRTHCNLLKLGLQNTADMRHEVFQLHQRLTQEQVKSKVLAQEMATPLNVHRWRKLNRFDPTRIELIKKHQRSQRRALFLSTKVFKLEEIVKALNEKIVHLEADLSKARQPVAKAQEKLMIARVGPLSLITFASLDRR